VYLDLRIHWGGWAIWMKSNNWNSSLYVYDYGYELCWFEPTLLPLSRPNSTMQSQFNRLLSSFAALLMNLQPFVAVIYGNALQHGEGGSVRTHIYKQRRGVSATDCCLPGMQGIPSPTAGRKQPIIIHFSSCLAMYFNASPSAAIKPDAIAYNWNTSLAVVARKHHKLI
jgi:hypothetical protein